MTAAENSNETAPLLRVFLIGQRPQVARKYCRNIDAIFLYWKLLGYCSQCCLNIAVIFQNSSYCFWYCRNIETIIFMNFFMYLYFVYFDVSICRSIHWERMHWVILRVYEFFLKLQLDIAAMLRQYWNWYHEIEIK